MKDDPKNGAGSKDKAKAIRIYRKTLVPGFAELETESSDTLETMLLVGCVAALLLENSLHPAGRQEENDIAAVLPQELEQLA